MNNLRHNLDFIRQRVRRGIYAVVKADAYGHGLAQTALYLAADVEGFCVSCYREAEALLDAGIKKPILILGESFGRYASNVFFTAATFEGLEYCLANRLKFNIKVNTGMNRIGFDMFELAAVKNLCLLYNAAPYSVFSHFFNAADRFCSDYQIYLFEKANEALNFKTAKRHLYASNCLDLKGDYMDFVRCGIAMYGYGAQELLPAMRVKTKVCQVRRISAGEYIGYGSYAMDKDVTVATVKAGYGDGFRRLEKPRWVSVKGTLCPVLGQVCMDMTMIDVSEVPVKAGDDVFLLGEKVTGEALAQSYGTITYEVLTGFSAARTKRIYVNKDRT